MKYFNVIFLLGLFGIIFYFTIDSRDIKRGIKNFKDDVVTPIDNKIYDLVEGTTPEQKIQSTISFTEKKIIEIETSKKYFCDPNFSLKEACLQLFSEYTFEGNGGVCEDEFMINMTKKKIKVYGLVEEKKEESCTYRSEDLDNQINILKSEIIKLQLILSEGKAREYYEKLKAANKIKVEDTKDECTPTKVIMKDPKCLKEYNETKQKKIAIIDEWYESQKNNEGFKNKINEAKTNIPEDSSASYNWEIVTELCEQMISKNKKVNEMFKIPTDRYHEFCGISYNYFVEKILTQD